MARPVTECIVFYVANLVVVWTGQFVLPTELPSISVRVHAPLKIVFRCSV